MERATGVYSLVGDYRGGVMITAFWNMAPCSLVVRHQTRKCHILEESGLLRNAQAVKNTTFFSVFGEHCVGFMIHSVYEENKKHLHPRAKKYGGDQFPAWYL
jgi:hypothetical protein